MANVLVTPAWITNGCCEYLNNSTVHARLPQRFQAPPSAPLNGKVLLAVGAAAVIANPRKVSRRGFFGLGLMK